MREGWSYKKLGEVATVKSGKSINASNIFPYADNLYPCYGGNGIRGYVDTYDYDGLYPIIGRVGALCGNIHLASGKFYATEHALVVKLLDSNVAAKWLSFCLESLNLRSIAKGVAQPVISASEVSNVILNVPPLSTQQQIVEELDLLNSIIEKQKAQLKELDNLAQSLFYDMFGDPVTNEKGWEVKKLKDISLDKLSYGSGASSIPFNGKCRYIRITDITDNGELNDDMVSPSQIDEKYILNEGDILFARSGATVGKTYLHKSKYGECIYAGYLIRLVPNQSLVIPLYVFGFTKTSYYKGFVKNAQNAVAQPNINAKQYGDLTICLPPLTLQQQFAERVASIEHQKSLVKQSLKETETLFNSRMDYYFN